MPSFRRYFQNPYFQVFELKPEQLTGTEVMLDGTKVPNTLAHRIGKWYFGPSPLAKGVDYPTKRFGPYTSYAKALAAAKLYFNKK